MDAHSDLRTGFTTSERMHTPTRINYVQCAEGDKRPQQPCEQHAFFLKADGSRLTAKNHVRKPFANLGLVPRGVLGCRPSSLTLSSLVAKVIFGCQIAPGIQRLCLLFWALSARAANL